jgi:hypothetical protein
VGESVRPSAPNFGDERTTLSGHRDSDAVQCGLVAVLIGMLSAKMDAKFEAIDQRFDDMRDLWRAELHRVEEVLDARLKHLESR